MTLKILTSKPDITQPRIWQKDPADKELWLHVPSGIWYVRKKMKGKKPLFKTTGHSGKGKARARANQLISDWIGAKGGDLKKASLTFGEYAPKALADWLKSDEYKPRYKKNLELYIGQLITFIGYATLADINEDFIEAAIADIRKKTNRETYRDYVSYITKVMRHAKRKGLVDSVPEFENPDPKKETGRLYSKKEIRAIFGTAETKLSLARAGNNRQAYLRSLSLLIQLRCCFNGFMRLREALCAPWAEVDVDTGEWNIPPERTKMGRRTGRGKHIFVDDMLILPLLRELQILQVDLWGEVPEWVFPNPIDRSRPAFDNKTAWKRLLSDAEVEDSDKKPARWHDLRHTAMTWALVGDEDLQAELETLKKKDPAAAERLAAERLQNPLLVAGYSGTNVRTIQDTYLKIRPHHTRSIAACLRTTYGT